MKDSQKLIFGIGSVLLGYLVNYLTLSSQWLYLLILILFLLFLIPIFGIKKINFRYQKDLLLSVSICILSYFFITYLSGIFVGFRKNIFHFNLDTLSTFLVSIVCIGIITEILRYLLLQRYKNKNWTIYLFYFFFVFIDILPQIVNSSFSNFESFLGTFGFIILPIIFENILFCYLSLAVGYQSNILYKIIMRGYIYFIPLIPNYTDYLSSIIKIIFPILIFFILYQQFQDKREVKVQRPSKIQKFVIVPISLLLIIIVGLVSGYFQYFALTIGSMSMSPAVDKGDILIIEKTKNVSGIQEGNILAFNYDGKMIVHRVIKKITREDQSIYFETQGDYNETADNHLVSMDEVVGVARLKIKYLGLPTVWLNESFK